MSLDAFSSAGSSSQPSFAWSALLAAESSLNFELFCPFLDQLLCCTASSSWLSNGSFILEERQRRRRGREHFSWAATLRHRVLGLASRLSLSLPSSRMKVFEVSAGLLPLINWELFMGNARRWDAATCGSSWWAQGHDEDVVTEPLSLGNAPQSFWFVNSFGTGGSP